MEKLLEIHKDIWIARAKINELREQDINPNTMPKTMFDQLTINIKKRGTLESLPFCAEVNGKYEIISGHHRIRAARAAGMDEVYILLDTSGLSRDEIIAKQLAHNNINGTVDPDLTLRLFEQIKD
ncbi:MAG: chromosome partitioning protein ParB, partial [Candidatus Coatesbacteria bacterium]